MDSVENQLSNNDEYSNHVKIKKIKRKLKTIFNDLNGDIKVKLEEMQKSSHETRKRLDHLENICIPFDRNYVSQKEEVFEIYVYQFVKMF